MFPFDSIHAGLLRRIWIESKTKSYWIHWQQKAEANRMPNTRNLNLNIRVKSCFIHVAEVYCNRCMLYMLYGYGIPACTYVEKLSISWTLQYFTINWYLIWEIAV